MSELPSSSRPQGRLLRGGGEGEETRVTYFELFFDLVFVFAVTQVSHLVLHDPSWAHLGQALFVGTTVWWVWVYTAWITNWVHPDRGAVRAMLGVHMLLGLVFATAIPDAFGDKGALFAIALVAMNLGRSVFTIVAFGRRNPAEALNLVRISTWFAVTGVLWVVGGFLDEPLRLWLWLPAFLIDLAGPYCRFRVPGLGASPLTTWTVSGSHLSERVSLFVIIALGESVIVVGEGFGERPLDAPNVLAFLAAFVGTVLMWLLYFNHTQQFASRYISQASQSGQVAQIAFTYTPTLLILGIVLTAIGNGLVLEHPTGPSEPWTAGLLNAGAAVYLLGNALLKRATGGQWLVTHLAGAVAFVALALLHPLLDAITLSWLGNAVMLAIVILDEVQFRAWRRAQGSLAD